MSKRDFSPIHPREILREEFLIPRGISQYRLAKEIHVRRGESMKSCWKSAAFPRTPH